MSRISEIADTVVAGQRRDMEKDSTAPGKDHSINVMVPEQPCKRAQFPIMGQFVIQTDPLCNLCSQGMYQCKVAGSDTPEQHENDDDDKH